VFDILVTNVNTYNLAPPDVVVPGLLFTFPERRITPDAPKVFQHSQEAGPDQTFFVVGEGLTQDVVLWGISDTSEKGQEWKARVLFCDGRYLAATLPENCYDGVFVAWVKSGENYSQPFLLNSPQCWWVTPDEAFQGGMMNIFGRNLARRPDFSRPFVYTQNMETNAALWLSVIQHSKYRLKVQLPSDLPAGEYAMWCHTGVGGTYGWSNALQMKVREKSPESVRKFALQGNDTEELRQAIAEAGEAGGGVIELAEGFYEFDGTLKLGTGVLLQGRGKDKTILRLKNKSNTPLEPGESVFGQQRTAIWLNGDQSGLRDLTVEGAPVVDTGVLIRHEGFPRWIENCVVENVTVTGVEGKRAENRTLHLCYALRALVRGSELWGRAPIFLSGARQCIISDNRLVCQTRFGGNSEGAILGRTNVLEECIIENNVIVSPSGSEAGGPTARRMIWVSTGHGSITHNFMAHNRVERARFGGVAGTDQNVGEMILFEACQRIAYFGRIESATNQTVTLPETVPTTPDERLGNVTRESLAYDDDGNETPLWPPDVSEDDGITEPPINQYYVTILDGNGLGQTRRVERRTDNILFLNHQWREIPNSGALVVVSTLYYQNLVVNNETCDGMTGIQLWIGCVENIVSGNIVRRQRKPGIFLYAACTTLASSMPTTWNRGIGPFNFNLCEGNLVDECSDGALLTSGDAPELLVEFPRAVGNVLRHNSFLRSRSNGVIITSRKRGEGEESPSIVGTIVEFNVVRDSSIAYHVGSGSDFIVLRRNHAYFWYPVSPSAEDSVGFQFDVSGTYVLEQNSLEGTHGTYNPAIVQERHLYHEDENQRR